MGFFFITTSTWMEKDPQNYSLSFFGMPFPVLTNHTKAIKTPLLTPPSKRQDSDWFSQAAPGSVPVGLPAALTPPQGSRRAGEGRGAQGKARPRSPGAQTQVAEGGSCSSVPKGRESFPHFRKHLSCRHTWIPSDRVLSSWF